MHHVTLNFHEYQSFLNLNSPDILALWETMLDDSTGLCNHYVIGYPLYFQKDFLNDMHSLTVNVSEDCVCRGIIIKNVCGFLLMFFYFTQCLDFFLYQSPSLSFCMLFILFYLT